MLRIVLVPALLLGGPALAESQSSDSSSNCSNGRCTRVESFTREGGGRGRERIVTRESWREGRGDAPRGAYGYAPRGDGRYYGYGEPRSRSWDTERRVREDWRREQARREAWRREAYRRDVRRRGGDDD